MSGGGVHLGNGILRTIRESDALMQFTGLLDKQGKGIYEGDIIKECTVCSVIWDGDGVIEECPIGEVFITPYHTTIKQLRKGKVKVKKGTTVYKWSGKVSDLNMTIYDGVYQWPDDIEVIGNIYENPELLEAQDGKS